MVKKSKKSKKSKRKNQGSHGTKDIESQLAEMNDAYKSAEEKTFEDIPNGKYQVKINAAVLNNSQSSDRFQCSWEFTVIAGDFKKRKLFKHAGLDNEESISYFKGDIAKLGIVLPEDMTDLPETLEEVIDTYAQITVRKKKDSDIVNIYFDKALDSDDVDDDDLQEVDDDDVNDDDESNFSKGDRVIVDIDGDEYVGEIVSVDTEGETANIDFDDGDNSTHDIGEISYEDSKTEEVGEVETECSFKFTEDDLKDSHIKKITKFAKVDKFDPDDYDDYISLLADVAEYRGVFGTFAKVSDVFSAIEDAK